MTPDQRTELQRLAEAATPGEWSAEVHGRFYVGNDGDDPHFIAHLYSHSAQHAAYIAAANPAAILSLLSDAAEAGFYKAGMEFWKGEAETQESRYEGLVTAARQVLERAEMNRLPGYTEEALDALSAALDSLPQGTDQ